MRVRIIVADITTLEVDAIVNAANDTLLGGGGVDGAIHAAAGPELLAACRPIGGCPVGEARITPGFRLPASHVIHTVGPVWHGGERGEPALLDSAYESSLALAAQHGVGSIAFPAISTGVFAYPVFEAASMAVAAVLTWARTHELPSEVWFCCFSEEHAEAYRALLGADDIEA